MSLCPLVLDVCLILCTRWVSEDFEEVVCIGSIEELKELSGYTGPLDDIHRDKIDDITIPSKQGKGTLRRVDEVFDCWLVPRAPSPFLRRTWGKL